MFVGWDTGPVARGRDDLNGHHAVGIQVLYAAKIVNLACGLSCPAQQEWDICRLSQIHRFAHRGHCLDHHDATVCGERNVGVNRKVEVIHCAVENSFSALQNHCLGNTLEGVGHGGGLAVEHINDALFGIGGDLKDRSVSRVRQAHTGELPSGQSLVDDRFPRSPTKRSFGVIPLAHQEASAATALKNSTLSLASTIGPLPIAGSSVMTRSCSKTNQPV